MLPHDDKGPEFAPDSMHFPDRSSSNIKMLLVAAAFLFVAIGLILIIPEDTRTSQRQLAETPQTDVPNPTAEVSRSDATLLTFDSLPAAEAVSRQLRQPIRLTDSNVNRSDLNKMSAAVLADFGYFPKADDRLMTLLVQALSEGQSNAYIDALLNTAAARGEFTPPRQLLTRTGRMDTERLLVALVRQVSGQG